MCVMILYHPGTYKDVTLPRFLPHTVLRCYVRRKDDPNDPIIVFINIICPRRNILELSRMLNPVKILVFMPFRN